jgi:L-threonylcarbamoyladenylate synthase
MRVVRLPYGSTPASSAEADAPLAAPRAVFEEAAAILRAGGLVAFPTETVYGLGARARDPAAIARVYAAKGRPAHHPLIAHVLDEDGARALAAVWNDRASRLARAFWPGPLTLVVPRAPDVDAAVAGGGDSIAVRAPANAIARALIEALGDAIAAPSANRYQEVSPTSAAHVVKSLGDAVDLVIDGGPCERGIESTVVDVRGDRAVVLRPGPIDLGALRAIEPSVVAGGVVARAADARPSPGMDARHYAPRARLIVADTWADAQEIAVRLAAGGARVGLVLHTRPSPRTPDFSEPLARQGRIVVRMLPGDAAGYARDLYGTLHDMDDASVDAIVVEDVPQGDAWWAVADRLHRGAAG